MTREAGGPSGLEHSTSGLGCDGGDITPPPTNGRLDITTNATGPEADPDGYAVALDNGRTASLFRLRTPSMRAANILSLLLLVACDDDGTTEPPPPVVGVAVTPSESPPLRGGDSFQFSAVAQDEHGNALPTSITWSIGSPELATISTSGLVTIRTGTGHGSGSISVIAASDGKQGQASVPLHDWSFEERQSPFAGDLIRVASISAETGPASLHVRCQATHIDSREPPLHMGFNGVAQLQIYVTGEIIAESQTVTYQLDQQPERGEMWAWSTDSKSLFYTSDSRSLARMVADADTLRFEYQTAAGPNPSTFAVRGLEPYIDRLFENCLTGTFKVSGDGQTSMVGSELPNPLVIEVRGPDGAPASGVSVGWIMSGAHSGQVSSSATTTDNEGHASVTWTIGSNEVSSVSVVGVGNIVVFTARGIKFDATTTITSIQPEPSIVGQEVKIDFTVSGGGGVPSRTVAVFTTDGSAETCHGVLSSGSGSCNLTFTAPGNHLITARYLGDDRYNYSEDTEQHQVN